MRKHLSVPIAGGTAAAIAAGLALTGCSSGSGPAAAICRPPPGTAARSIVGSPASPGSGGGPPNPAVAAGWTTTDGNLQSTRDAASPITSSNVSRLGVAWTVPVGTSGGLGGYAATPVVVGGVVYTQDLESDVLAIQLATGKVLWRHDYHSGTGGPNGVAVAGGTVYAATATGAVALQAATGRQLWSRTLIRNSHEDFDMAPGYHNGTVYLSTSPVTNHNEYVHGGKGTLYALNAATGSIEWSWDEVQNLWGNAAVNSGGGLWYPPSFDAQGNLYLGIANPAPFGGAKGYPWGTSRPGPDLYTDSVVKLSPRGKLLWYYQLTPHDLYDWDLEDPPVLTTANGQPVVIGGGKAGILVELSAQTGRLLWQLPVGIHNRHDDDGLLAEHARTSSKLRLPASVCIYPGNFGGIESQLASNGSATFAAVNNLAMVQHSESGPTLPGSASEQKMALLDATGEVVAVDQETGKLEWARELPSSPYGAVAVTNDVVFTTTFTGDLYALNAATGAILLKLPLSAGTNAPVIVDGDYVITGAGVPLAKNQHALIIAYKLGATGELPDTTGP